MSSKTNINMNLSNTNINNDYSNDSNISDINNTQTNQTQHSQKHRNKKYSWQNEVSCSISSAIVKIIIVQPFDMIRFRLQTLDASNNNKINFFDFISKTQREEGLKVFFKASSVTSTIIFLNTALQLTFFQRIFDLFLNVFEVKYNISQNFLDEEKIKKTDIRSLVKYNKSEYYKRVSEYCNKHNGYEDCSYNPEKVETDNEIFNKWNKRLTILNAKCGLFSGLICGLLFSPLDNIRIRMLSSQNVISSENQQYKNTRFLTTAQSILSKEGIRGFYIALNLALLREGIASSIYFSFFEYNMNKIRIWNYEGFRKHLASFFIGAGAGACNWLITLPIDVVKTKIISDRLVSNSKLKYKSSMDCALNIYHTQGFQGFYVGFKFMMLRSMIVNGFVLSCFDFLRYKYDLK